MRLQGKNKFDTWLLNSDWTPSLKYILIAFIALGILNIYWATEGTEQFNIIHDALAAGFMFTSAMYYSMMMYNFSSKAKLQNENLRFMLENHELKQEILILKMAKLEK